jgi:hypothetical protein
MHPSRMPDLLLSVFKLLCLKYRRKAPIHVVSLWELIVTAYSEKVLS